MPPSLAPYDNVYERFHPSFEGLIASTLFDDLYLVDHGGRVVYSLQKDSAFAADLTLPRFRDTPLAQSFREVMARLQQASDPQRIFVVSGPQRLEDSYGILLARPVIQHDIVEGVVAFRLPVGAVEQRLTALQRPGIRIMLLDAAGNPIVATQPGKTRRERAYGPFTLPEAGWQYVVLADSTRLAGGLWAWFAALLAASAAALGLSGWALRRLLQDRDVAAP